MATLPFFSIIMPAYNAALYISEALDAVRKQSFTDWELILVDDGSTDDTVSLFENLNFDGRFRIYKMERNSGSGFLPRYKGSEEARGKYIVTLDADDKIGEDFLKLLYQSLSESCADLVIPEMWRMEKGKSYKILPKEKFGFNQIYNGKNLVKETLIIWEIPMAGFAVRKELYLKAYSHFGMSDFGWIFDDEVLSRWLLLISETVVFSHARYFYRNTPTSVTHDKLRTLEGCFKSDRLLVDLCLANFGKDSPEYEKAEKQRFFHIIEAIKTTDLIKDDQNKNKELGKKLSHAKRELDTYYFINKVGLHYILIMLSPLPIAKLLLKGMDMIKKHSDYR